jgi:shikimate kinase
MTGVASSTCAPDRRRCWPASAPAEGCRSDATDAAWLEARADERDAAYQQLATFSVDVDKRSPEEVAAMIVRLTSVG